MRTLRSIASSSGLSFVACSALIVGCGSGATGSSSTENAEAPGQGATGGAFHHPSPTSPTTTTNTGTPIGGHTSGPAWDGTAPKGSVPVTGGTLLVMPDGTTAVAADPDRDMVSIVDLGAKSVLGQIALPKGSEPGRLVADGKDQVHVILRRGGGIADIDVAAAKLLGLRQTCALPRGVAYDAPNDDLLVSCMTGELITMSTDASKATPLVSVLVHLQSGETVTDLRDVLITAGGTFVTTFRAAGVLNVAIDGTAVYTEPLTTRPDLSVATFQSYGFANVLPQNFHPDVAWRAVVGPAGDIVIVHQGATDRPLDVNPADQAGPTNPATAATPGATTCTGSGAYGGETCQSNCAGTLCAPPLVIGMVSSVSASGVVSDGPVLHDGALPVDIAPTPDGTHYVVALAGNPSGVNAADGTPLLNVMTVPAVTQGDPKANSNEFDQDLCGLDIGVGVTVPGEVVAVAVESQGNTVAQTRDPAGTASLQYLTPDGSLIASIPLSSVSVANEGFDLFHTNTGQGVSCAGCHAEGQDDGRVWNFSDGISNGQAVNVRSRRTQTFREGFLQTAPFHWDAEFPDMDALVSDVFVHRMAATAPSPTGEAALDAWMDAIPSKMHDAPSSELASSISRGKTLFDDASVGCATCHSGSNFTNNETVDIGFGYATQVPTLIDVAFRAPYLHDGTATTLMDRFTDATALSGKHGHTAQLSESQLEDLVAYMSSL